MMSDRLNWSHGGGATGFVAKLRNSCSQGALSFPPPPWRPMNATEPPHAGVEDAARALLPRLVVPGVEGGPTNRAAREALGARGGGSPEELAGGGLARAPLEPRRAASRLRRALRGAWASPRAEGEFDAWTKSWSEPSADSTAGDPSARLAAPPTGMLLSLRMSNSQPVLGANVEAERSVVRGHRAIRKLAPLRPVGRDHGRISAPPGGEGGADEGKKAPRGSANGRTALPEDLFIELVERGRDARSRGQHMSDLRAGPFGAPRLVLACSARPEV
mmetsp:Transcript_125527/g.360874  ORF Transcript_125527/g.360874 Transcript_125527/m.360874 type:complete len:275 (-) Transcript_125527:121-945(-)